MGAFSTAHCVETMYTYTGHTQIALNDPSKRSPSAADLGIRSVLHFIHPRLRRQFTCKVQFEPQLSKLNHINFHLSLF